jgi:hypothetical protein
MPVANSMAYKRPDCNKTVVSVCRCKGRCPWGFSADGAKLMVLERRASSGSDH